MVQATLAKGTGTRFPVGNSVPVVSCLQCDRDGYDPRVRFSSCGLAEKTLSRLKLYVSQVAKEGL